ncbi:hypothetical protein [Flammeovirga aprica]|uniref:Uncharacterized protein n=1 Tax=Flammeovirga aprica JL-4 TaxID=694437 RepID=A0A7X9XA63_9BACT|nr:hypothetical protein [Flammeovirga aprica]NME69298.1 hypothetical protein [Flammeovirga aprica JL-4]
MQKYKSQSNDYEHEEDNNHDSQPISQKSKEQYLANDRRVNGERLDRLKGMLLESQNNDAKFEASPVFYYELKKVLIDEHGFFSDFDEIAPQVMRLFTPNDEKYFFNDISLVRYVVQNLNTQEFIIGIQDWRTISLMQKVYWVLKVKGEIPYWLFLKLIKNHPNVEVIKRKCAGFDYDRELEEEELKFFLKDLSTKSYASVITKNKKVDQQLEEDLDISELLEIKNDLEDKASKSASHEELKKVKQKYKVALNDQGFANENAFNEHLVKTSKKFYNGTFLPKAVEIVELWLAKSESKLLQEYNGIIKNNAQNHFESLCSYEKELQHLSELKGIENKYFWTKALIDGGSSSYGTSISKDNPADELYHKAKQNTIAYSNSIRNKLASNHPIFLDPKINLLSLYEEYVKDKNSSQGLAQHFKEHIVERLENIEDVRETVLSKPEKVLAMELVIEEAKLNCNFTNLSHYNEYIDSQVQNAEDDKLFRDLGLALLSIGAGILTAYTGGAGYPVLAGVLGASSLAVTGIDLYYVHTEYFEDKAIANTSIDPELALSQKDPALGWLLVAYAGAIIDLYDVIKVLPKLSKALRSGKSISSELTELGTVLKDKGKIHNVSEFVEELLHKVNVRRSAYQDTLKYILKEKAPQVIKEELYVLLNKLERSQYFTLKHNLLDDTDEICKGLSAEAAELFKKVVKKHQEFLIKHDKESITDFINFLLKADVKKDVLTHITEVFLEFNYKIEKLTIALKNADNEKVKRCIKAFEGLIENSKFEQNKVSFSAIFHKLIINISEGAGGLDFDDIDKIIRHLETIAVEDIPKYLKKFEGEKLQDIKAKKFISSVEAVIKDPEKLKKFLNGVKDDIPLTDLFKGIKSEREKGLLLIEATNPELVQLIRKNKLPSSMVKEKYRDLLKYLDDFDFSKYKNLGDVESKFRKGFYAHYVQIIPDKPSLLTEFLQPFRQGFGSVAEHYILQEKIIRILYKIPKNIEVNIIKPILDKSETFKNLKGNTVNFQPDGLFSSFISGNKHKNVVSFLIEVKAGYTNGGISETQIENYIILLDMILKKKEGYKEILSNLSSSAGIKDIESFILNGMDYIFIEHKVGKKAGDNARMAAEKAYDQIKKVAKKKKAEVIENKLIRVNYLDDEGQLHIIN